jgi:membrane-associated protease RseP (regulator of RpoE activity)
MKQSYRSMLLPLLLLAAGVQAADPASSPELEKAHADLKAAWQQTQAAQENLARVESKLGIDSPRALAWEFMNNPKRGALGLVFARGRSDGALRIQAVSPGSAADTAGLREGDTLLAIDKLSFAGLAADESLAALHKFTRTLETGTKVKVQYSRDGKTGEVALVASRPPMFERRPFDRDGDGKADAPPHDLVMQAAMEGPIAPGRMGGPPPDDAPFQLAAMNPDLAAYFKVDHGVLVLSVNSLDNDAPAFGLKAGDVIQQVDGQPVNSPMQVFDRLLRAAGTTVKLSGARGGAPLSLNAPIPPRESIEARMGKHRKHPPVDIE